MGNSERVSSSRISSASCLKRSYSLVSWLVLALGAVPEPPSSCSDLWLGCDKCKESTGSEVYRKQTGVHKKQAGSLLSVTVGSCHLWVRKARGILLGWRCSQRGPRQPSATTVCTWPALGETGVGSNAPQKKTLPKDPGHQRKPVRGPRAMNTEQKEHGSWGSADRSGTPG